MFCGPCYKNITVPLPRSTQSSAESRFKNDQEQLDKSVSLYFEKMKISTIEDLKNKIDTSAFPEGYSIVYSENRLMILSLEINPNFGPKVSSCLSIFNNLEFEMICMEKKIPIKEVFHIAPSGTIESTDSVYNILAHLKNMSSSQSFTLSIDAILSKLSTIFEEHEEQIQYKGHFQFIVEQLKLSTKNLLNRRYSPSLLAAASLWHSVSPALYRILIRDESLCLPSIRHLRRFTSGLSVTAGISEATKEYLRERIKKLNERERMVNILFDEVYSARRCEYSNGKFYGYDTSDGTAKTVLCFMLTGVASSYKDIVCMVPLSTINANIINKWFWETVKAVTEVGFHVVASISDGYSANRKFFTEHLRCDKNQSFVINPYAAEPKNKIYPLFDTIHIFKGLYTNLLNRQVFECPKLNDKVINGNLQHIRDLYKREIGACYRYASKLNHKVIDPKPIERSSVDLAVRFYSESTETALRYYANIDGNPDLLQTAGFLKLIRTFFNIINVKTPNMAARKRDECRKKVTREDSSSLLFLEKFLSWVIEWRSMKTKKKLSTELYFCLSHTLRGLIDLCRHILETTEISYILLGKINSDPLERRFGVYRQLNGANFFVSVKQFMETEKKLRLRSLIRMNKMVPKELKEMTNKEQKENCKTVKKESAKVLALLQDPNSDSIHDFRDLKELQAIIFFCSGYVARSLLHKTSCQACKELLNQKKLSPSIKVEEELEKNDDTKSTVKSFMEMIDRGGLVYPSELVYTTTLFAVKLQEEIFRNKDIKEKLLQSENPRDVFVFCFQRRVEASEKMDEVLNQLCTEGHSFYSLVPELAKRTFNFTAKNFVTAINDTVHENRKRHINGKTSENRKVTKLSSDSGM